MVVSNKECGASKGRGGSLGGVGSYPHDTWTLLSYGLYRFWVTGGEDEHHVDQSCASPHEGPEFQYGRV